MTPLISTKVVKFLPIIVSCLVLGGCGEDEKTELYNTVDQNQSNNSSTSSNEDNKNTSGEFIHGKNKTFTVNGVSFTMIAVQGGSFRMGGTTEQTLYALDDEYPVHNVSVSNFYIGETEVTQELWKAVAGNPNFWGENQFPANRVSWEACQTFIAKLNELTGVHFRMPTEAEWEYAARGGIKAQGLIYSGSNYVDAVAWYSNNAPAFRVVHENGGYYDLDRWCTRVQTKAPNELGIYDMSGNVWEYCSDWYGTYPSEDQVNPKGPISGDDHVARGGGVSEGSNYCRVSHRSGRNASYNDSGLRLAL